MSHEKRFIAPSFHGCQERVSDSSKGHDYTTLIPYFILLFQFKTWNVNNFPWIQADKKLNFFATVAISFGCWKLNNNTGVTPPLKKPLVISSRVAFSSDILNRNKLPSSIFLSHTIPLLLLLNFCYQNKLWGVWLKQKEQLILDLKKSFRATGRNNGRSISIMYGV